MSGSPSGGGLPPSLRLKKRQADESTPQSAADFGQNLSANRGRSLTKKFATNVTATESSNANWVTTVNLMESALKCPICLEIMEEPYATICAHTFCRNCLVRSLEMKEKCPKCGKLLERKTDQIFPNFTLDTLTQKFREIKKQTKQIQVKAPSPAKAAWLNDDLMKHFNDPNLDVSTVSRLIEILTEKRNQLEQNDALIRNRLLKEFLDEMIAKRRQKLSQLTSELKLLETDLKFTENSSSSVVKYETSVVPSPTRLAAGHFDSDASMCDTQPSTTTKLLNNPTSSSASTNTSATSADDGQSLFNRRRRLRSHFDDLEQQYFSIRNPTLFESDDSSEEIEKFVECLTKMTQFSGFRRLGTLNYNVDMYSGLSIVSSIEFDREGELFTIAGVTKKIKVYNYSTVLQSEVDIHYPVGEMQCGSKISCVSWNPYNRSLLASSDYEGIVQLWDVLSVTSVKKFQEHEKRCWSVCFNFLDPNLMASGSDDAKVKLWNVNCKNSVGTLEAKVNVCCVHFNPESRFHLAFGSADHCVHYYDLRNPKQALTVFRGHKKAVSYVKFINPREIVSASTDSQLRLWSVDSGQCVRVFKGHQNEKNFVGLDTDNDFIACGSENNYLYVYYKELAKPLMMHSFGVEPSILERDRDRVDPDSNDFVSAVCWKKKSNVVLAANSLGTIQILEQV